METTMKIMSRKALVVYYSLEGSTKFVAEKIADAVQADIMPLEPEKDIAPGGFFKYFQGGMQVFRKTKPVLKPLSLPYQLYKIVFLGSPVWAGNFTPAVRSFMANDDFTGRQVAVFCTHRGGPGSVFDKFKIHLNKNEVIGQIDFRSPFGDRDSVAEKAGEWAKFMMECLEEEEQEKLNRQGQPFARAPD